MDIGNAPFFAGLTDRLKFLSARTSVLAENVANADTPGFVARDIEAPKPGQTRVQSQGQNQVGHAGEHGATVLRTRDARHIAGASSPGTREFTVRETPDGEASLTGNRVSLETQTLKLSGTRMEYQMASTVYRKAVDMMRLAARGGR